MWEWKEGGLLTATLSTLAQLVFEKQPAFIYSPSINIIYIHIHFLYLKYESYTLSYIIQFFIIRGRHGRDRI